MASKKENLKINQTTLCKEVKRIQKQRRKKVTRLVVPQPGNRRTRPTESQGSKDEFQKLAERKLLGDTSAFETCKEKTCKALWLGTGILKPKRTQSRLEP